MVSKVPLPDYRADLDDRHGSTQKEVQYITNYMPNPFFVCLQNFDDALTILSFLQIRMPSDIERRVGSLLNNTQSLGTAPVNIPPTTTNDMLKQSTTATKSFSAQQTDSSKEKLSVELKERQDKLQVHCFCLTYKCQCNIICFYINCAKYFTSLVCPF